MSNENMCGGYFGMNLGRACEVTRGASLAQAASAAGGTAAAASDGHGHSIARGIVAAHQGRAIQRRTSKSRRNVLDKEKVYLDTAASYHQVCSMGYLEGIQQSERVLKGECNAGTTYTNVKGWLGDLHMWIAKEGIANLISLPQLERDGWDIEYKTGRTWNVCSPQGTLLIFRKNKGGQLTGCPMLTCTTSSKHFDI